MKHFLLLIGATCSDPGTPTDAVQIAVSYEKDMEVTFKCNRNGYSPKPVNSLKCVEGTNAELKWNSTLPTCVGMEIMYRFKNLCKSIISAVR